MRSDHEPQFVAFRVEEVLRERAVELVYVEPGGPWQNGYVDRFDCRFKAASLSQHLFHRVGKAAQLAEHDR